jgi:hypothetical protein
MIGMKRAVLHRPQSRAKQLILRTIGLLLSNGFLNQLFQKRANVVVSP